jgi:signal transduction histidine kinase
MRIKMQQNSLEIVMNDIEKAKKLCGSFNVNEHADGLVCLDNAINNVIPIIHGNAALGERSLKQGLQSFSTACLIEFNNTAFDFSLSLGDRDIEPALARDIYAFVFHAAQNAGKHSKADKVNVFVERARDTIEVSIIDNGHGLGWYTRTFKYRFGLYTMRDIASSYNGKCKIRRVTKGTVINVVFPLKLKSEMPKTVTDIFKSAKVS